MPWMIKIDPITMNLYLFLACKDIKKDFQWLVFCQKKSSEVCFYDIIPAFLSAKQLKVIIKPQIALISRKTINSLNSSNSL